MGLLSSFINDKHVASIAPTRRRHVRSLLKSIELTPQSFIVEFGPGTGAFTKELLSIISPQASLVAFETNPELCKKLEEECADPRLHVINDSALKTSSYLDHTFVEKAQLIVSGIPLSFLSQKDRHKFFQEVSRLLAPQGVLVLYQAAWTPFLQQKAILQQLREHFILLSQEYFFVNLPPLVAMQLAKHPLWGRYRKN